ncbi:MAG TPA: PH domain-containing protein [Thermoanaerobaculia bacterium]
MEPRKVFRAPWSRSLQWMTGISVGILLAIPLLGLTTGPRYLLIWQLGMVVMPLAILLGSALFVIRGYELESGKLLIRRLLWTTTVDLAGLQTVSLGTHLMRGSIRVFGNGGLFSLTGRFYNRLLGMYRAFATDPDRAVALRFADRVVVITPDDPQAAARELDALALQPT